MIIIIIIIIKMTYLVYLVLRSVNFVLSIVPLLYGFAVLRVNWYGSIFFSGGGGGGAFPLPPGVVSCVVPNFSRSLESSCLLAGLDVYFV